MLLCSVHMRVYMSALDRWFPADPVHVKGVSTVIPITEGTCDECLATAKICMFVQFPELYVQKSLTPSV